MCIIGVEVIQMTIAERIRNRRLELGLSVDDLANRLQKNRATVYRYESNYIKSYSPDVMESLAKALETTPAYFYGYEEADPEKESSSSIPRTPEARLLARGVDKMTAEQRETIINIMNGLYPGLFEKGAE